MESSNEKLKFVADQMLGQLAKWLRILGFDTEYLNSTTDSDLLRVARDEGRILLTRDSQLFKTRPIIRKQIPAVLVRHDRLEDQLRQLIEEFRLDETAFKEPFCTKCNARIQTVAKSSIAGRVPSYVFKTQDQFAICPQCGSIYWKGTHWEKMRNKIADILAQETDKTQLKDNDAT